MKYTIRIKPLIAAILAAASILAAGCAPMHEPMDYSNYYWPKEPLPARLRILNIVYSDADIRSPDAAMNIFGQAAEFGFQKPHDIVVDDEGIMYVADPYRRDVSILNPSDGTVRPLGKQGGWRQPIGLGIDTVNNIIAVSDLDKVVMFDYKTRRLIRVLGKEEKFSRPQGLAFDTTNRFLYIVDTRDSAVYKYDYNGKRLATLATLGGGPGDVFYPSDVAVDSKGQVFVVDTMNWRINIYDKDGQYLRSFGKHGSIPGQFNRPRGISISKDDIIALTDTDLAFFMLFSATGQMYAYQGGVGKDPVHFTNPMGIHIAKDDKIYIVDETNRRIKIYQMYTDRYYKENPVALPVAPAEEGAAEVAPVEEETPAGGQDETGATPAEATPAEEETPAGGQQQ